MERTKSLGWNIYSDRKIEECFVSDLLEKRYEEVKILKNDQRSYVAIVKINQKEFVLKVPREKNRRKWQRLINVFRNSDSVRSLRVMLELERLGIKSTRGVLAMEKKTPLVVDSLLVMEVLNGQEVKENYKKVIKSLEEIHNLGYLHGDSQIQNFLFVEEEIYSIDLKLKKNIYGKFGRMYEYVYLRESCKEMDEIYNFKSNFAFKIAYMWKKFLYFDGYLRKIIKGK